MKIKCDVNDLIRLKFINTINIINGYCIESEGDMEIGQDYSTGGVNRRMEEIKQSLEDDISRLSTDIEVE